MGRVGQCCNVTDNLMSFKILLVIKLKLQTLNRIIIESNFEEVNMKSITIKLK